MALVFGRLFILFIIGLVLTFALKVKLLMTVEDSSSRKLIWVQIQSMFYRLEKKYDYNGKDNSLYTALIFSFIEEQIQDNEKTGRKKPDVLYSRIIELNEKRQFFFTNKICEKLLDYIIIENINWATACGSHNAMCTALNTGFIWSLKGIIIAYLSSKTHLENINLKVEPDFSKICFFSEFNCILKIRIVHIISIIACILLMKLRGVYFWIRSRKKTIIPFKV